MAKRSRPAPSAPPAAQSAPPPVPASSAGHWTGLAVLTLIVVFVAAWMYMQSRATVAATHTLPALPIASDSTRFAADAWYLPADDMLGFVEVPAGPFTMGSDPSIDTLAYANERWSQDAYQGKLELPTFYVGRYEVTIAEFREFARATRRDVQLDTGGSPDRPIANVSWTDALAYARWLQQTMRASERTPPPLRRLLDDGWRVTLPSEAEWEKAARGSDGRIFPWGASPSHEHANFQTGGTVVVGSLRCESCAHGLADMSGNVWELTRSPFQPYPYVPGDKPSEPQAEALYIMRGGSFSDGANNIRAAVRGGIDPGARRPFIGFRLVITKF